MNTSPRDLLPSSNSVCIKSKPTFLQAFTILIFSAMVIYNLALVFHVSKYPGTRVQIVQSVCSSCSTS
ncbi:hypothetical protein BDV29DRAFT_175337 [Aspergillus leporis]|uniref:Uncharacterized protein n=1 Tax=Aspergillus leporis TaxID=41062 RepID=A0A5N5WY17_9EURO|nr:hypothetical protein BDV29DRAFT_175337 [Aspergillus leporis]